MEKHFFLLFIPLVLSNFIHMLIIKKDLFSFLRIPLSVSAFGKNKTVRGFVVLPVANGFFVTLFSLLYLNHSILYGFDLGALLGLTYMLFELPNSFMKRRLGIAAGESARNNKWLFALIDKCDSTSGVCLIYFLTGNAGFGEILFLFLASVIMHSFFSFAFFKLKLKAGF